VHFQGVVVVVLAGHVERLSMGSCFPRMIQLEREYGSLVRAMIRLKAKKVSPKGSLLSFKQGMATLIQSLVKSNTFALRLGQGVNKIAKVQGGYRVNADPTRYDVVILACPTHQLVAMEFEYIKPLQSQIADVVYPTVYVVHFLVPKGSTTGFGFLNPSMENRLSMGALFSDQLFENRAPYGCSLVTVLLGGDHHPEALRWTESEAVDRARNDLMNTLNLREDDLKLLHVVKWTQSIPQYYVNHREKVALMDSSQKDGLYITGNAWHGVGINDCVKASYDLVARISMGA
ncbi:MAG: protoporphyrinogen oxidase, partial [Candidatus Margulisiibacteriota bacterium]